MTSLQSEILDRVRYDLYEGKRPSTRRHNLGSPMGYAARLYTALYYGIDDGQSVEEIMKDFN